MCAINGSTGSYEDRVRLMNAATQHRGPDGTKVFCDGRVTLGFNRLAIIDLSDRAMQPMQSADGRYTIVFNGELYNYKALANELSAYPFTSESDTEVALAAFVRWGEQAFSKFNGMFGLAIWDSVEERLVLTRDSAGVKSVYWTIHNGELLFSSELGGVLAAHIPTKLSLASVQKYLTLLYVPGDETLIEGVQVLPPGGILSWYQKSVRQSTYTAEHSSFEFESYTHAVSKVREVVSSAVTRQLVSDRPVGIFLSGGLDSSIILAAATSTHPHINTYSMGYALDEHEDPRKFNADAALAQRTASHFGATHHEYYFEASEAVQMLEDAVRYLSDPVGNATALSQLYLARQTKPTATVVLSGEGGDELFGGYERYRLAVRAAEYARYVPRWAERFVPRVQTLFFTGVDRYAQLMFQEGERFLRSEFQNHDSVRSFFAADFQSGDIAQQLMRADERHWLVGEALRRADQMGMAASVEIRVPFLDAEVLTLAHTLPRPYAVTTYETKRVLRDAFRDVLPTEILSQPKRGWFSPGAKWLRRPEFVALADEVFSGSYTPIADLFAIDVLRNSWAQHRNQTSYHYTALWSILTLFMWARQHHISL